MLRMLSLCMHGCRPPSWMRSSRLLSLPSLSLIGRSPVAGAMIIPATVRMCKAVTVAREIVHAVTRKSLRVSSAYAYAAIDHSPHANYAQASHWSYTTSWQLFGELPCGLPGGISAALVGTELVLAPRNLLTAACVNLTTDTFSCICIFCRHGFHPAPTSRPHRI